MSATNQLDLRPLADKYDIVGEVGAREDGRAFIGKRREDGAGVLIVVTQTPNGDEANALTHFAADTNLLATLTHRNLVRVLEGRWIGRDAFAVVSDRTVAPTLDELLSRHVAFSGARIAAILRDVGGVLEWARGQKVVHRAVTAQSMFLDPATDRVLVSFEIRQIPLTGAPDAEGDAKTIAALASAMLTSNADPAERTSAPLAELRPDLPKRVVDQTEALLRNTPPGGMISAPADTRTYIATIAMADAVKAGEEEAATIRAAVVEEQRVAREQLAAERREHEQHVAEEQGRLAEEREEHQRAVAREREEVERTLASERQQLAIQREHLLRSVATERDGFAAKRADLELAVAAERETLVSAQQELEQRRAEIAQHLAEAEQRIRELDTRRVEIERTFERDPALGEAVLIGAAVVDERPAGARGTPDPLDGRVSRRSPDDQVAELREPDLRGALGGERRSGREKTVSVSSGNGEPGR